jgi:hypothetical protein
MDNSDGIGRRQAGAKLRQSIEGGMPRRCCAPIGRLRSGERGVEEDSGQGARGHAQLPSLALQPLMVRVVEPHHEGSGRHGPSVSER